jgi:chondroitin 4-sulfotransferase 11
MERNTRRYQRTLKHNRFDHVVFVHIPKTAGKSIKIKLGMTPKTCHAPISWYLKRYYDRDYRYFTFIRNPWDRLVSLYHYYKCKEQSHNIVQKRIDESKTFEDFCYRLPGINILGLKSTIEKYESNENILPYNFMPQVYWIDRKMDFIGRFENLQDDFRTLSKDFFGNEMELDIVVNTSDRIRDYRSFFNNKTRDAVASVYVEDIKRFGYSFDAVES